MGAKQCRVAEYRADAFVASIGYKAEMISVLEILNEHFVNDNSFTGKLMSTHPAIMLRIGALEDGEIQKDSFGSISLAIP